jgi:CheY-like chemotaxis protein
MEAQARLLQYGCVRFGTVKLPATGEDMKGGIEPVGAGTEELRPVMEQLEARATALRALAGEWAMADRRDRRRLSKVIHDHLQQLLASAKFQLSSLHQVEGRALQEGMSAIDELLARAMAISRSLTAELSPPLLHECGLAAGIEWLSRRLMQTHRLDVRLTVHPNLPAACEDVNELLFQAVHDLLQNVVRHAGVLEAAIDLQPSEVGRLRVTVSDLGRGFDPQLPGPPAGLGLFGIREHIEQIGGTFQVRSAPGRGTCVTLVAPLAPPDRAACGGSPGPADGRERACGRIRILLTDDHPVMREGLARLLGQEADMAIVGQAGDGQEAVELAAQLRPDVILMDISMPRLNGVEATRRIHREHPDIRIIGLSLYEEEERAREMRDAGAVAYLTKSGPAGDLKTAIRTAGCRPEQPRAADRLAAGPRTQLPFNFTW